MRRLASELKARGSIVEHENELRDIVRSNRWFMALLHAVRNEDLPDWVIAAGVIRNIVWDHLHGYASPTPVKDVDVAFFDRADISRERDSAIEQSLKEKIPEVEWDVTNQAGVHLWYEAKFGHPIPPITSIEDAVSRNPETVTSVGVRLEADESLTIVAPLGLEDLFAIVLRHNTKQVTREYFEQRLRDKAIEKRWPKVRIT